MFTYLHGGGSSSAGAATPPVRLRTQRWSPKLVKLLVTGKVGRTLLHIYILLLHIISLSKVRPYFTCKAASSTAVYLICQSLTTAIAFGRDCPKNRFNVYRRAKCCKNCARNGDFLNYFLKLFFMSLPFLDSFIGFPSRNGSATKLS